MIKRKKIEAVLRRKVRVKITKRKRGRFTVRIPALLFAGYDGRSYDVEETFLRRRDALTFLYTKLRLIREITRSAEVRAFYWRRRAYPGLLKNLPAAIKPRANKGPSNDNESVPERLADCKHADQPRPGVGGRTESQADGNV